MNGSGRDAVAATIPTGLGHQETPRVEMHVKYREGGEVGHLMHDDIGQAY